MIEICYRPIGVIHSPFREIAKTPGLPMAAKGAEGQIELKSRYQEGLQDLKGFSHLILIYHFHLAEGKKCLCGPSGMMLNMEFLPAAAP
jgi:tRNA (adenine37-N6)-methyltransferase